MREDWPYCVIEVAQFWPVRIKTGRSMEQKIQKPKRIQEFRK